MGRSASRTPEQRERERVATNARRAAKRAAAALGRDWQPADPALAARRTALIDPEDYSHPMSDVRVGP